MSLLAKHPLKAANVHVTAHTLARLETLLESLIVVHEELLALAKEHRAAIASADQSVIGRCLSRQQTAFDRLRLLDQERVSLIRAMCPAPVAGQKTVMRGAPDQSITISSVAADAPEPHRSRLISLGSRLKALITDVASAHRVIRLASESLLSHMHGLISQVSRSLSHTGIYVRPNSNATAQVCSALDVVT